MGKKEVYEQTPDYYFKINEEKELKLQYTCVQTERTNHNTCIVFESK